MADRLTKEQYELLEAFGQGRLYLPDWGELRRAVHLAVRIIPFKDVSGMEYIAEGGDPGDVNPEAR